MTRTKSSRALLSVVLAVLMAAAFMPSLTYSSFAATAKKATKVTKASHADKAKFTRTVGTAWTLKYKLSPSKLTSSAKKVTWKSSNSKVAKITTIKSGKAVVSFKSTGSATVTVATKANPKAKTSWKFKVVNKKAVKKVAATGVTVAADNTTDYTKTLEAGTTLTATVAPADATGVTYQWYADDQPISGATSQKFKVTTDQIGKAITVKATDDSKNTVASTASAKVSDVTLTGVALQKKTTDQTKPYEDVKEGDPGYSVGTVLKINGTLTGASKVSDVAAVKWIRTIKSANGTAVDTTVAENTDTYTVTKADLEAVQKDATVTIKAEVTPNANVKAYGTTSGKFTTKAAKINGDFVVSIQANGKDVKNVKAGTKLTAVVTPSDVKVTYQWYKDGKQIAGATSAEYTSTEDGNYRVHAEVAKDETVFNKSAHDDAYVKVGGKTIEKVVLKAYDKDNNGNTDKEATVVTPTSVLKADAQWLHGAGSGATATYTWYRNGVKLENLDSKGNDKYGFNGLNKSTLDLAAVAKATEKDITTADSFYCVVTGTGDFLSDPVTSNTVKIASLGELTDADKDAVTATYNTDSKTLNVTGLNTKKYTAQPVTVVGSPVATVTPVDNVLDNHMITDGAATDVLKDFNNDNAQYLYIKLEGTNGYTGTKYAGPVTVTSAAIKSAAAAKTPAGTGYTYVGTLTTDANGNVTATYTNKKSVDQDVMNDLARYLGSLHQNGASEIQFNGKTYKWDPKGTLQGSNWTLNGDAMNTTAGQKNTLVSAIVDYAKANTSAKNITLTVDGVDLTYSVVLK
ncbi:MAG: hypothetical protein LKE86_08455 [Eubacterium sp.]|jgi:hypothetical protein|nr:hypothetical protein [Eubacterium sp.]MCH4047438.1 hypothetical protein [Eubacterium sp.]MCH4080509.1 hypothetical protein [Eubacterium sp.]